MEAAELAIIQEYLPAQLSPEALRDLVREVVNEVGAASPKDMGRVMQALMPRVRGAADGKLVSRLVQEALKGG